MDVFCHVIIVYILTWIIYSLFMFIRKCYFFNIIRYSTSVAKWP